MECAISKPLMLSGRYFSKKELRQVVDFHIKWTYIS